MPKTWHDRHAANKIEDEPTRNFYRSIVADKKPYFMRYIYPALMKQYNTYIKNTERNAFREFQMAVSELRDIPIDQLSERQCDFLKYYDCRMPVGIGDCVMNKICRRFEQEFDGYIRKHNCAIKFDYRIMRGQADYSQTQYNAVKKLYEDYNKRLKSYAIFTDYEKVDNDTSRAEISVMNDDFKRRCLCICQNEESLCNIILDLCYTKGSTKRFAWSMCGQTIIKNLLNNNNNIISFPVIDSEGSIDYCGDKFSIKSKEIGVDKWE